MNKRELFIEASREQGRLSSLILTMTIQNPSDLGIHKELRMHRSRIAGLRQLGREHKLQAAIAAAADYRARVKERHSAVSNTVVDGEHHETQEE